MKKTVQNKQNILACQETLLTKILQDSPVRNYDRFTTYQSQVPTPYPSRHT